MKKTFFHNLRTIEHLTHHRFLFLQIVWWELLYSILDLGGVITLAYATDQVTGGSNVTLGLVLMASFMLVGVPISGFSKWTEERYALTVRTALIERFEEKVQHLPLKMLAGSHSGQMMALYSGDIDKLAGWYSKTFPKIVTLVIYLIGATAYSLSRSVSLTLIVIPVVALVIPFLLKISGRLQKHSEGERKAAAAALQKSREMLADPEFIKAYCLEESMETVSEALLEKRRDSEQRMGRTDAGIKGISLVSSYLPGILAAAAGGFYLMHGWITVGFLIGFVQMVMGRFSYVFPQIGDFLSKSNYAEVCAGRLLNFLNSEEETAKGAVIPSKSEYVIKAESVSFSYDGKNDAVKEMSVQLKAGERIAFTGPSGSGKSTAVKLIMGYYPTDYKGHIQIMGRELPDWRPDILRGFFSPVFQDSFLFPGTVEENIGIAVSDAIPEEVRAAACKAEITEELLHRQVEEGGKNLSGGQRQRIAIARAVLKDAPVFLLDEPMSALDSVTENQLIGTFETLLRNRTTITVAHRLRSVIAYDQICYMEQGEILEQGTHEELMALNGRYAALYRKQEEEYHAAV